MRITRMRCRHQGCSGSLYIDTVNEDGRKYSEVRCMACGREHTLKGELITPKVIADKPKNYTAFRLRRFQD